MEELIFSEVNNIFLDDFLSEFRTLSSQVLCSKEMDAGTRDPASNKNPAVFTGS